MKNIKETIIGVFAVIGFVVVASGFTTNNATQQPTYGTPESHVWEIVGVDGRAFAINKQTGETKLYVRLAKGSVTTGLKAYTAKDVAYGESPKN
tara:strand:+ start:193 stop:474 length:282 start_codon:yes stop_codon:yes gene_type:complete